MIRPKVMTQRYMNTKIDINRNRNMKKMMIMDVEMSRIVPKVMMNKRLYLVVLVLLIVFS